MTPAISVLDISLNLVLCLNLPNLGLSQAILSLCIMEYLQRGEIRWRIRAGAEGRKTWAVLH
jgi:hypothetical protein